MYKKYPVFLVVLLTGALSAQAEPTPANPAQENFRNNANACQTGFSGAPPALQKALAGLYTSTEFRSLWSADNRPAALNAAFSQLEDDGLIAAHYQPKASNLSAFCQDLALSHGYLQALFDLHYGRLERAKVQPLWQEHTPPHDDERWAQVLTLAQQGLQSQVSTAFEQARPRSAQYLGLRKHFQQLRHSPPTATANIPEGAALKPGATDARVPALAQKLSAAGYFQGATPTTYSPELVSAVKAFQQAHGLQADGVVGGQSLAALNQPHAQRLAQIRVNLERWRWLEHEQEPEQILVDIAGGFLHYEKDGQILWAGRTQVGRLERLTPEIKSTLTRVNLNPSWTIPPTILREDKLPKIRQNPNYLARHNLRVLDRDGNVLNPRNVNWSNPGSIMLRQAPGKGNPLGRMIVRFDNPHAIYLHDTPSQQLFARAPRDFSSGCVRVEGIQALLKNLLDPAEYDKAVGYLQGTRSQQINFTRRIPILLAYWTAEVDRQGALQLKRDIYQRDAALAKALDVPKK